VAAIADPVETRAAFRALLLWGLSMTIVGAVPGVCRAARRVVNRPAPFTPSR
jgi:hypothetical protein